MIGILNRWRQFGRRYFWPHLLLGMVAASLGLPHGVSSDRTAISETAFRSLNSSLGVHVDRLALLQANARWPNLNNDYWHQHAIRTVIRHLSFTLTPASLPAAEQAMPLEAHKLALLDTLNALLTREVKPPAIVRQTTQPQFTTRFTWKAGLWLAQVSGIRAGPAFSISSFSFL
ncbi:secA translation cis-regulator SecM [Erwinia psidii]|uniref:Secretion monitor n=1 Tax=Erwinia psidii TaxID=69224 RepID=A0A3N6SI36_9GAMM|nr:secA translation cis-regulator SecM [Erwinia psidii]MCX8957569.1 secA regulator SecM [Erwinia psidii]MCX8960623.1 secA regulator SecM [Erwinia psidii]MCX8964132.1 secA regulator SecM [Erwinia psidii]RQM39613.1 secA regulator SecM [Erwinia psidii]